ncbi:MAG: hypothetical protein BM556_16875 [Bacteriovorax sp. MedPE-SWde]|nr:MAG: hypothetical protein BM556_16875 [Bacteriovorax sp. MedPE-SWde]
MNILSINIVYVYRAVVVMLLYASGSFACKPYIHPYLRSIDYYNYRKKNIILKCDFKDIVKLESVVFRDKSLRNRKGISGYKDFDNYLSFGYLVFDYDNIKNISEFVNSKCKNSFKKLETSYLSLYKDKSPILITDNVNDLLSLKKRYPYCLKHDTERDGNFYLNTISKKWNCWHKERESNSGTLCLTPEHFGSFGGFYEPRVTYSTQENIKSMLAGYKKGDGPVFLLEKMSDYEREINSNIKNDFIVDTVYSETLKKLYYGSKPDHYLFNSGHIRLEDIPHYLEKIKEGRSLTIYDDNIKVNIDLFVYHSGKISKVRIFLKRGEKGAIDKVEVSSNPFFKVRASNRTFGLKGRSNVLLSLKSKKDFYILRKNPSRGYSMISHSGFVGKAVIFHDSLDLLANQYVRSEDELYVGLNSSAEGGVALNVYSYDNIEKSSYYWETVRDNKVLYLYYKNEIHKVNIVKSTEYTWNSKDWIDTYIEDFYNFLFFLFL